MTTKQAQRSKQKKALKRKKQVAGRRTSSALGGEEFFPEFDEVLPRWLDSDLPDLGVTPEDYLPDGQIKVSAALLAMARPVIDSQEITEQIILKHLLTIAMMAWNIEVGAAKGQPTENIALQVADMFPDELRDGSRGVVEFFRAMKCKLFPNDLRLLVNLDVVGADGNWQVNVTSLGPRP